MLHDDSAQVNHSRPSQHALTVVHIDDRTAPPVSESQGLAAGDGGPTHIIDELEPRHHR